MLCMPKGGAPWMQFPDIKLSFMASENSSIVLKVSAQQYLRQVEDPVQDCYKYGISPSESGM